MTDRVYLSAPDVRDLEREALLDVLESNWIAPAGPALDRFELELADQAGRSHAVCLSSGTAAIHLALLELGVAPGDEVLCSTLTFIGSAAPIVHVGASPVFIDAEPAGWNMDPELLGAELARRATTGDLPAAIVVVDLYGNCADYAAIAALSSQYEIPLIEDAAEAIGATHPEGAAGSFGRCAVFSFNGNKLITTSGGGALVTDDAELARRVRHLSTQAREPFLHYEHVEVGFNYRMSNVLAAIGSAQLGRLDERIARRREISGAYRALGSEVEGVSMLEPVVGTSNHWLTCMRLTSSARTSAASLIEALDAENIEARPVWKPMHIQPVFGGAEAVVNGTSERLFHEGVCLPSGSGMTDADLERVLTVLNRELR